MTNTDRTHPFAKQKTNQLSRRSFTKGMLTAGMAFAAAPFVLPNVVQASTGTSLPVSNSLQNMITQQFIRFNGGTLSAQPTLAGATQNDVFHKYLGQQLQNLYPTTPRAVS